MEWLTKEQAAKFFGRDVSTIKRWVTRYGVRKRVTPEGRVVYPVADLDKAFLRGRRRGLETTAH